MGTRFDTQQGILNHCVNYFSQLLASDEEPPMLIQDDMNLLMPFRCSLQQKEALAKPFTNEEITEAFFSLPKNKASRPDGYSSEFFKGCWSIFGTEATVAVAEFFYSGEMLQQWKGTTLVLIQKLPNASSTSDFRHISCLNTVYKVMAKLIAGRLQRLLSLFIYPSQSALLPGRLLGENVLLATEIIHGYNRKNIEPRGMLKVDLRKAFDSVRWDFLLSALRALDIPKIFVNWIIQCITTPTFTVEVRQGDPMPPYLFVLAMEVFSNLLLSCFEAGYIHYHPMISELSISHLMFADDVMIFFDGGSSSLHGINDSLEDFTSWSWLRMNRNKTQLFHAGLNQIEFNALESYDFTKGSLPIRYLGLPLMSKNLKISDYDSILAKLSSRFRSWSTMTLSFARRSQLIASVISGTVNFWISTFCFPKVA